MSVDQTTHNECGHWLRRIEAVVKMSQQADKQRREGMEAAGNIVMIGIVIGVIVGAIAFFTMLALLK